MTVATLAFLILGTVSLALAHPQDSQCGPCDPQQDQFPNKLQTKYIKGATLTYANTFVDVLVNGPLGTSWSLRLVRCGCEDVTEQPDTVTTVSVPATNLFVTESPTMFFFQELEALDHISIVTGINFVFSDDIHAAVDDDQIRAIPNITSVLLPDIVPVDARPTLAVVGSFDISGTFDANDELREVLPFFPMIETEEATPLGRAEWVKIIGLLTGTESEANSLFDEIEARYQDTRRLANSVLRQPSVVANQPFQGAWFNLAPVSYPRELIRDANAVYRDINGTGEDITSLQLTVEQAAVYFASADYWINVFIPSSTQGNLSTTLSIKDKFNSTEVSQLHTFEAVQCGRVWSYAKRIRYNGDFSSLDFFESGIGRPDLVLNDMVRLLHPTLFQGNESEFFYYYNLAQDDESVPSCQLPELPSRPAFDNQTYVVSRLQFEVDRFDVEDALAEYIHPAIASLTGLGTSLFSSFFDQSEKPTENAILETTYAVENNSARVREFADLLEGNLSDAVINSLPDSFSSTRVVLLDVEGRGGGTGPSGPSDSASSGLSTGAIVGIVIGVLAGLLLVALAVVLFRRSRSRESSEQPDTAAQEETKPGLAVFSEA